MKVRTSFVSNSSSSSFLIIESGNKQKITPDYDGVYVVGDEGEIEFGWANTRYGDVHSKINFAYMQAEMTGNNDWIEMLVDAIKEESGAKDVQFKLTSNWSNKTLPQGYIDHQSAAIEGENTQMFSSMESLKTFLFSDRSYIQGGNDNEY